MRKVDKLTLGKRGEDVACDYLEKINYIILERNYKNKYAEIDVIAKEAGVLVFIEVRTTSFIGVDSFNGIIGKLKIDKMKKNALAYVTFNYYDGDYRLDLVCIALNSKNEARRFQHYRNITL